MIDTNLSSLVKEQVQFAITRIAESDSPVLILGEHGVGKRSTARRLHEESMHRREPYTEIECRDLDRERLLPILHTNGTVHLYEIAELSPSLQDVLVDFYLRSQPSPPCRLLFSSSGEPATDVRSRRMSEDFYYLASALTLRIPPLRCRKFEIPSIVDQLMTRYSTQFDRPKPVLCREVKEYLVEHSWPGNLFELQTAIKTFVVMDDQAISFAVLRATTPGRRSGSHQTQMSLKDAARAASSQIERQLICEVLAATGGNRKRAADELGISYKALLYKIKRIEAAPLPISSKAGLTT